MNRITVQPGGPDRRVPVENLRNAYFEQGVPREVNLTEYVQRRLDDGDLVVVPAAAPAPKPPAAKVDPADNGGTR